MANLQTLTLSARCLANAIARKDLFQVIYTGPFRKVFMGSETECEEYVASFDGVDRPWLRIESFQG